MRRTMTPGELVLAAIAAIFAAAAIFGPALAQPAHYHQFADQRMLLSVPFAMDVLSNLTFLAAGLAGAWTLWRAPARSVTNVERAMAALFFGGLVATTFASSWYHLSPDDSGLVIDRLGMSLAFAGLLGLVAATHVSDRAGAATGLLVLLAAPITIHHWAVTGNITPWAVLQFGGMLLIAAFALIPARRSALQVGWLAVVGVYGAAKLLELYDHEVFSATLGFVSGHTVKHVLSAAAAIPVILSIRHAAISKQNARLTYVERPVRQERAGA